MRTKFYALAGLALIAMAGTVAYATTRKAEAAPEPTGAAPTVAANCCDDPSCPPGCSPDCPPDCKPTATVKAAAKPCCAGCCEDNCGPTEKATPAAKTTCPPCWLCP